MDSKCKRPVVASYISSKVFNSLVKQRDRKYRNIRALVKANQIAQVTLYFFSYAGVDFTNAVITGIYYNEHAKGWRVASFPFPDVFYERANITAGIRKKHLSYIRKQFDELHIKKINSLHCFDKWHTYVLLSNHVRLRSHQPLTRCVTTKDDLHEMLQTNGTIYVKSRSGCRGKQVMSVRKLPGCTFEYKVHRSQVVTKTIQDFDTLCHVIDDFFGHNDVIIQEAIELLNINSHIIDLRGEVQRNGRGHLEVTAILFRVGRKHSPVATRGQSFLFEKFCKETLGYEEERIAVFKRQVEHFLCAVYTCMEDCHGPFGEIGIDLGLDIHGKIWFIECNAKSGKVSLCNSSDEETIDRAFLNPLQYAKHIYTI